MNHPQEGMTTPDAEASALAAHSAGLRYGSTAVVHECSVRLAPNRVTALVGPNGSGKSTLLRAMAGLHPVADGEIGLGDRLICDFAPKELARRLTMLAQHRPTPGGLTVADVVAFGRHPHRGRWRANDPHGPAAVDRAMALTELHELADRPVDALSGGQIQRVWLASCLAQDTSVVLLDEPTNHLDLHHQVELLRLVRQLADTEGVTVGVVLHDLAQAGVVADHLVLLDHGRVVAEGTAEDVLRPDLLSQVYGVDVAVDRDPATGLLRVNALGSLRRPAMVSTMPLSA
ncbi:ABC transporter ATP-binding protein [Propionibacteriaceae bacterium Y2011]|uniref:ABC transporter ATP-binding protein n=1 Tax=Microlunatus sp. Y2014 TaxID=3418488 RepID=UPI003B4E6189